MQETAFTSGPESTAAAGARAGAWDTVASAPAWSTRSHLDILAMAALLHSSTSRHACAAPEMTMAAELLSFRRPLCYLHVVRSLTSASWKGCFIEAAVTAASVDRLGNAAASAQCETEGCVHKPGLLAKLPPVMLCAARLALNGHQDPKGFERTETSCLSGVSKASSALMDHLRPQGVSHVFKHNSMSCRFHPQGTTADVDNIY